MAKLPDRALSAEISRRSLVKGVAAAAAAFSAASVAAGCSAGGPSADQSGKKIFRWVQASPGVALDVQRSASADVACVADAVCEGLLRWSAEGELVPVLAAESPAWSEDGLVLTMKLKEGVKFHNSADFTAEDVKYTFTRMFRPETEGVNTALFDMIQGAGDVMSGDSDELSGVEVVDDLTVAFHLSAPFAQFESNLGTGFALIYPHEACGEAGSDWGAGGNLVGTGPYKMVSDDGSKVVLEANASWHGGEAALDGIEVTYVDDPAQRVRDVRDGDADACGVPVALLEELEGDEDAAELVRRVDTWGTCFIVLNMQDEAFQDTRVRQALSLAVDRQELVDTVFAGAGSPCACLLAPGIPGSLGSEAESLPYDPERALALVEEAGAGELTFSAATTGEFDTAVMEAVSQMWEPLGMHMRVSRIDADAYASGMAAGSIQCLFQDWFPLYPDGGDVLYAYFQSANAAERSSHYASGDFDDLVGEASRTLDGDARAELYRQADALVSSQDFACIPLVWPQRAYAAAKGAEMGCSGSATAYRVRDAALS